MLLLLGSAFRSLLADCRAVRRGGTPKPCGERSGVQFEILANARARLINAVVVVLFRHDGGAHQRTDHLVRLLPSHHVAGQQFAQLRVKLVVSLIVCAQ